jgi:hypothetical protein
MFVELNMAGTNCSLGRRIPEDVSGMSDMAEQEATSRDILVLTASVLGNVCVGKTAERAKIADVGFPTIEEFERNPASE